VGAPATGVLQGKDTFFVPGYELWSNCPYVNWNRDNRYLNWNANDVAYPNRDYSSPVLRDYSPKRRPLRGASYCLSARIQPPSMRPISWRPLCNSKYLLLVRQLQSFARRISKRVESSLTLARSSSGNFLSLARLAAAIVSSISPSRVVLMTWPREYRSVLGNVLTRVCQARYVWYK